MTRRPRRDRPARLPDRPPRVADRSRPRRGAPTVTPGRQLVRSGVWGPHPRLGRDEVRAAARRLVGTLDPGLAPVTVEEVLVALETVVGPQPRAPGRDRPDPGGARRGRRRGPPRGGRSRRRPRSPFATAAPASLLALHAGLARAATDLGGRLATADTAGPYESGRSLWWLDDVAVATDGHALLEEPRAAAGDEWLFAVGRPALAVADGVFAVRAIAAGVPTLAFADLDGPGPALAAHRGQPVVVVPVALRRPPAAYGPLAAALAAGLRPEAEAAAGPAAHDGDAARHRPHLATETPFPYAAPPSGGEG